MTETPRPPDLEDLDRRLRSAQRRYEPPPEPARPPGSAIGMAFRAGVDLVAGVFVGGAIGYGFDLMLGTSPFGLVVFFFLGAAAGLVTVIRSALRTEAERDRSDREQG